MKRKLRYGLATALIVGIFALLPFGARAEGGVLIDETNFPNAGFRRDVSKFDTNEDGKLSSGEIKAVTKINTCSADLTGIKNFTSLTDLCCYDSLLTNLDVSGCTSLTYLSCSGIQLTNLDVSGCTSLDCLYCDKNQLTNLDVSSCTSLKMLDCNNNQLTNLDVSGCTSLDYLDCGNNQLIELDVSGCTSLKELKSGNNQLTKLDVSGCTPLTYLYCSENQLTKLDVRNNTQLHDLYCNYNQLTELTMGYKKSLKHLECVDNHLTELDLSECVNGFTPKLYLYGNGMKKLYIDENSYFRKILQQGYCKYEYIYDLKSGGEWYLYHYSDGESSMTIDTRVSVVLLPMDLSTATATLEKTSYTYNGKEQKPKLKSVTVNGITLKEGTDYTVTAPTGCKNVGTYTYKISGMGRCKGTLKASFKINKAASKITLKAQTKKYNAKAQAYSSKVTKSGSSGKVTYNYYSDSQCKKGVEPAKVKNAGTYYVRATLAADTNYEKVTSEPVKFTIQKVANPLKLTVKKSATVKLATLKKKNAVVKCITVKKNAGAVSYKLTGVKKASFKKYFAVNAKTGKITVKKGLKKGTYTLTVAVTAKGNANYKNGTEKITFKIVVK